MYKVAWRRNGRPLVDYVIKIVYLNVSGSTRALAEKIYMKMKVLINPFLKIPNSNGFKPSFGLA